MYSDEELRKSIEKTYGFKKELIRHPELCGYWHVRFEVNGIKYYGWIAHAGAMPQIKSEGSIAKYHDEYGTPVTNEYYNEYIKDKKICLFYCIDPNEGDWIKTNVEFKTQKEAERFIENTENPRLYKYSFC